MKKRAKQAVVRNALAGALANTGDMDGAMEHWDWILANARDSKAVPEALWMSAQAHFRTGRNDVEKLKAGKALLKEIVDKHGDHALARRAGMVIGSVDRAIDELVKKAEDEKKAAEEKKAEDEEEGGDEGDDDGGDEDK